MNAKEPCGIDFGNRWICLCLAGKIAKILAGYSLKRPPGQINSRGLENKVKAFCLIIGGQKMWFGIDILGGPIVQELDDLKYDPKHIAILSQAAFYQWSKQYNKDLATLGTLYIVASMPPGAFKDRRLNKQAESAYRKAFNRGQSHLKIRDGKNTVQIVTQFGGLQREAVDAIGQTKRSKALTLIIDIGFGTVDFVLFDGGAEPSWSRSDNIGLAHAYQEVNSTNPQAVELALLRDKKNLPPPVQVHFNNIKNRIVMIRRILNSPIDKIILIGGGAAMMTPQLKLAFAPLANNLVVLDDKINARANYEKAKALLNESQTNA